MTTQSLAQRRAKDALDKINRLTNYDNYLSYVNALPAAILMNGLGQAMATELASAERDTKGKIKNNDPHLLLYGHLSTWLCGTEEDAPYRNHPAGLMDAIVSHDEDYYLRAQAEAMAYLEWLKKFANAFLDKTSGQANASAL
ncbi:MAG: type III-B CRISPR module-associated protein Cmr5 [Gammaproteobacteria bacterium]|nr:type III-B CRISPR module-associated protein Cmr5 [Gammaproteobacteria bacterium]